MTQIKKFQSGKTYNFGFLQIDIVKSSLIEGNSNEVQKLKEIFKLQIEKKVTDNNGKILNWAGEGGSYFFPMEDLSSDASKVCETAIDILGGMPNVNFKIKAATGITKEIKIRISCDTFSATYNDDVSIMQGDPLNKFLKNERDIGIENTVVITERLLVNLSRTLRGDFNHYKYLDSLGVNLYGFKLPKELSEKTHLENIERLKKFVKKSDLFKEEGKDTVEIIGLIKESPCLIPSGEIIISKELLEHTEKKLIENNPRFSNDRHGIVFGNPIWSDQPITIKFKMTHFVGLETLRERSGDEIKPIEALSACIVVTCFEKKQIYLHRRSEKSHTYPNCLHTYGGAYMPPEVDENFSNQDDDYDLINTGKRELWEELKVTFTDTMKSAYMILAKELKTGFIQLVIFVDIPASEIEKSKTNWEGNKISLGFSELPKRLLSNTEQWVPTGKAHILAWLALGAPFAGDKARFGDYSAETLFQEILEQD